MASTHALSLDNVQAKHIGEAIIVAGAITGGSILMGTLIGNHSSSNNTRQIVRELKVLNAGTNKQKVQHLLDTFEKEDRPFWSRIFLGAGIITCALYIPALIERINK